MSSEDPFGGLFGDPDELRRRMAEFAEQMQGAQRVAWADNAIRVAAAPESADRGALLVVNETIHDARFVTKTHTVNPATFQSPHGGPVGEVTAVGVRYFAPPAQRNTVQARELPGSVPIVKTWTGMDSGMFDWWLDQGVDGLVIEGSGAGNVPGEALPGIRRLADSGTPVVLATRCIGGPIAPIYNYVMQTRAPQHLRGRTGLVIPGSLMTGALLEEGLRGAGGHLHHVVVDVGAGPHLGDAGHLVHAPRGRRRAAAHDVGGEVVVAGSSGRGRPGVGVDEGVGHRRRPELAVGVGAGECGQITQQVCSAPGVVGGQHRPRRPTRP